MPDITQLSTMQLVNSLVVAPASQAALAEIKAREIKTSDTDDTSQHRGGIRPETLPLNP